MRIHFHTQKEKKKKNYLRLKKKKRKEKKYNGYTVYFGIIVFQNNIIVTPCKEIRIPESGKFWLVESWILEKFVVESGIFGYVIQLKESGIARRQIQNPRLSWIPLHDEIIANKEDLV